MTALFVVIFLDQWLSSHNHVPALTGLGASTLALFVLGASHFIIGTMALILLVLTLLRQPLEQAEAAFYKEEPL